MSTIKDKGSNWIYSTHAVILGKSFNSFYEAAVATANMVKTKDADDLYDEYTKLTELLPNYMKSKSYVDTSLGGSEVFNPYWAFNEDDDIVMPMDETGDGKSLSRGLGLAYKEMYYNNQQVIHITCGIADYTNVAKFLLTYSSSELEELMNGGPIDGLISLFLSTGKLALELPWLPLIWTYRLFKQGYQPEVLDNNQYYTLRSAMGQYIRLTNMMMTQIASGLGLYSNIQSIESAKADAGFYAKMGDQLMNWIIPNPDSKKEATIPKYVTKRNDGKAGLAELQTNTGNQLALSNNEVNVTQVPEMMKYKGPDLYRWLNKRNRRATNKELPVGAVEDAYNRDIHDIESSTDTKSKKAGKDRYHVSKSTGWWSNLLGTMVTTAQGASDYIGFRMEKSTDSSESVSNSIGESELAGKLNAAVSARATRDFNFSTGNSRVLNVIRSAKEALTKVSNLAVGDVISVAAGTSFANIPLVWTNSNFSRSYSITIKLRARYGDPISVFQSIYVPLCLWLAMALPRQTGDNSYTTPFLIKAYSKGMFMIPLGMVESMQITRGADEFGWSMNSLPTSIDLSITIKDLNPALFVGLTENIAVRNSNLQEYLTTLSGIGLAERIYMMTRLKRKMEAFRKTLMVNRLSPLAIGNDLGFTGLSKLVGAVTPGLISNR